jgi:lysophospholipase L1-like esterase
MFLRTRCIRTKCFTDSTGRSLLAGLTLAVAAASASPAADKVALPTVVLVGDSIRMGYAPFVDELLRGKATLISQRENGGDTSRVLANLDDWVIRHQPAVVHFNCGLHDLKRLKKTGQPQVPLDQYEANLKKIIERLQKETKAKLIFATTTPINDERHAKRKSEFSRAEADVRRYNEVATKVMNELGVEIDDLHAYVTEQGADKLLRPDGTHYPEPASRKLAAVITKCIEKHLPAADAPSPAASK